jgi:hypothetical protein
MRNEYVRQKYIIYITVYEYTLLYWLYRTYARSSENDDDNDGVDLLSMPVDYLDKIKASKKANNN